MRTTVDLDPAVLEAARSIANHRSISLGKALSELALRGLAASRSAGVRNGFPLFPVGAAAAPITSERVREVLEDEE